MWKLSDPKCGNILVIKDRIYKWLNILSDILNKYNNRKNYTIEMRHSQVTE